MPNRTVAALAALMVTLVAAHAPAQDQFPSLFLTQRDVKAMREAQGRYPLFDATLDRARRRVDAALAVPIDVPVPKDAGGYTHERHKQNYTEMHLAGILYAVTGEARYAEFVKNMLLAYSKLYPTLGKHPAAAGEASGRLFWQTLNETVWLVHATQAYDCVRSTLSDSERKAIEEKIFRPMANFFAVERVHELDRIHNHGTWTCTAVGMTGYILRDRDLVDMALRGSERKGEGGFLKQLELLFSPDGFYTEGPYYVRYALLPFYTFAQVIENNQPELGIFEFRNKILQKALGSALQLTYTNGAFIPLNDALKEKSYLSPEIVVALDIAFDRYGKDPGLLPIAKRQNAVLLNAAGAAVAKSLAQDSVPAHFPYASVEYTDGPDGSHGGIGILRSGPFDDQSLVLMKYTGHGLSHGHYDKLAVLYYDQGQEILQDYGSARFINVEPKYGGRYLPENRSFAMQTISHNTVTVDGRSHFGGKEEVSERFFGERIFFDASDPRLQVMSARVDSTYDGVVMRRTVALVTDERFSRPVVIDVFRVESEQAHTYDLPFYYLGHLINWNVPTTAHADLRKPLGSANGYQHLWNEAEGKTDSSVQVSWIAGNRYYSVTSAAEPGTEVFFVRIGANDPKFNLRTEPGFILRRRAESTVFASVLEPHGKWDGINEFSEDARPAVSAVRVLAADSSATVVKITGKGSLSWTLLVAEGPAGPSDRHEIVIGGTVYSWTGPIALQRN